MQIFEHAKKDIAETIEFRPTLSDLFVMFAIAGIELAGERKNDEESAFMFWHYFHKPNWLTENGRKRFVEGIPIDHLETLRAIRKGEFLDLFVKARKNFGR